jgi:spore coat polysaccharide biosynthesis protein SpsF
MKTAQEKFWSGQFGNGYIARNKNQQLFSSSIAMYAKILAKTNNVKSILEFGANIGINLSALKQLLPDTELSALEINTDAVKELQKLPLKKIYHTSLFDYQIDYQRDFVFTRGVLIHLNPDKLQDAYKILYDSSKRYICFAEYYNPKPTMIPYHGQINRLFKRDFAGEIMDNYKDLKLIDYGFAYHRDSVFPQDDVTWFLLEKINGE